MDASLATWICLTLSWGVILYYSPIRWPALPIWVVLSVLMLPITMWPLGEADHDAPPPGKYTVIGADIVVDVEILALLKSEERGTTRFYRLPYSTGTANELQDALDASQGQQGGVEGEFGDGGEMAFHGPSVQEDQPKQSEPPPMEF